MKTILFSGYYGYGNAGDEAVLAGMIAGLREIAPHEETRLIALSGNPRQTEAQHGILAEHRYGLAPVRRAMQRADILVSGGGSLLQDVTSANGIFYYLAIIRMAQLMGKTTMLIGQGIGPLIRRRNRVLTARVANRAKRITVRDEQSAQTLREIGVRVPVETTADPALLLGPQSPLAKSGPPTVGVSLRSWQGAEMSLAETLARAAAPTLQGVKLLSFPMQQEQDCSVMEHFQQLWHQIGGGIAERAEASRSDSLLSPLASGMERFAACHMVLGMRLHALILAAACGTPSVALSYDPKVTAFMKQSGQDDFVFDINAHTPDLTALITTAWEQRESRAAALRERLPALRASALRNARAILY